jgi:CheY-like chemotaxis protein
MDINLGANSKDGIETVREIKRIKNIPIIYITGNADDDTIESAADTYPAGYIVKPFKRKQIKPSVVLALRQKKKFEVLEVLYHKLELKKIELLSEVLDHALENIDESTFDNYTEVKNEITKNILIEALQVFKDDESKLKDCEEFEKFVLTVEVVKDMLVNL